MTVETPVKQPEYDTGLNDLEQDAQALTGLVTDEYMLIKKGALVKAVRHFEEKAILGSKKAMAIKNGIKTRMDEIDTMLRKLSDAHSDIEASRQAIVGTLIGDEAYIDLTNMIASEVRGSKN